MSIITDISKLKRYSAAFGGNGGNNGGTYTNITINDSTLNNVVGTNVEMTGSFSGSFYGPVGGDLDDDLPNPRVVGLQTYPISTQAPVLDSLLYYNGSMWIPTVPNGDSNNGGNGTGVISGSGGITISGTSLVWKIGEPIQNTDSWTVPSAVESTAPSNFTNATSGSHQLLFLGSDGQTNPQHTIAIKAFGDVQLINEIGAVYHRNAYLYGFTPKHFITKLLFDTTALIYKKIMIQSIELTYNTGSFTSQAGGASLSDTAFATILIPNIWMPRAIGVPTDAIRNNLNGYQAAGYNPMYFPAPHVDIRITRAPWITATHLQYASVSQVNRKFLISNYVDSITDFSNYSYTGYGITAADARGYSRTSEPVSAFSPPYIGVDDDYIRVTIPVYHASYEIENLGIVKVKISF